MSKQKEWLKRAADLIRQVETGKIKGKVKVRRARKYAAQLRFLAKHGYKKPVHQIAVGQGFLPTFLSQMRMVRIEEMIAQKIFEELKSEAKSTTKKRRSA